MTTNWILLPSNSTFFLSVELCSVFGEIEICCLPHLGSRDEGVCGGDADAVSQANIFQLLPG